MFSISLALGLLIFALLLVYAWRIIVGIILIAAAIWVLMWAFGGALPTHIPFG